MYLEERYQAIFRVVKGKGKYQYFGHLKEVFSRL